MTYPKEFIEFWKVFPGRYHEAGQLRANGSRNHYPKIGKRKALEQWNRLSQEDKRLALAAAKLMRKGLYIPDAWRWLRDGKFDDFVEQ